MAASAVNPNINMNDLGENQSSFDSRVPNPAAGANYSNIQIVCRIKASQAQIQHNTVGGSATKRPNSACRINFQAYQAPAFKGKEAGGKSNLRINPCRSFQSVQSTPAYCSRSPSIDYQKNGRKTDGNGGYISLRKRMKPQNGISLPSGSPSPPIESKRHSLSQNKNMSQSGISFTSSHLKQQYRCSNITTPIGTVGGARHQDTKSCVFTTVHERSNKVIVSETPISARIVNDKLRESSQLSSFLQQCNQNGYDANVFDFDNVFSESQRQDKFYGQSVKPIVQSFVEGENGCVLFFGPSQSGKTFSLHGKAGKERGVVPRAIEDILSIVKNTYEHALDQNMNGSSLIEDFGTDTQPILSVNAHTAGGKFGISNAILQNSSQIQVFGDDMAARDYDAPSAQDRIFVKMSVYMIYCDRIYDLLSTKAAKKTVKVEHYIDQASQQVVTKFTNMTEKLVLSLEQYYALIQEAFKERKTLSMRLTDHEIRKRSHLIISLGLVTQSSQGGPMRDISRLNFTELCGSEQSVAQSGQARDTTIRQFVTKSFNCLSTQILRSALGKRTQLEEGDSGLIASLKNTLTSKSNVILVACASPAPQFFDHSLPAIKFCGRIRDTIIRKLQRQGFRTARIPLEESGTPNPIMKQTRFNLDGGNNKTGVADSTSGGPMSTFGRVSQLQSLQVGEPDGATAHQSSLKKPHLRKHSRSTSPLMSLDEITTLTKQLEGEVVMYDALIREFQNGNREAISFDEVREWSMRSLELVNKGMFTFQRRRLDDEYGSKQLRDSCVNQLFYLKERITAIEKAVMTVSSFQSISPKNREKARLTDTMLMTKYGHSIGTTSAATLCQDGRDNPLNQVINGLGSASRPDHIEASACSSLGRREDQVAGYFSGSKGPREAYATTYEDQRRQHNYSSGLHTTRDEPKPEPLMSQYGRQLSEKLEGAGGRRYRRQDEQVKVPMSARDGERHNNHHSLRDFSRSASRGRNDHCESQRVHSPPTFHRNQQESKKDELNPAPPTHDKLQSVRNEPELQLLQSKFLSSGRVQHIIRSTFGEQRDVPKALYASAEETLNDVQRLIMLEDFEGLRRRVMQLYKERKSCDDMLQVKDVEIEELREQLDARDEAVKHVERVGEHNLDEYRQAIRDEQQAKEKCETQSSLQIHNLQQNIEAQTAELDGLKTHQVNETEKREGMAQQFELNNRLRLEAEAKCARLQEENDKMFTNYDVLKEHELNIIKDFQDRKKTEQQNVSEQLSELRQQIDFKNEELNQQKKQIIDLEGELRKQQFETTRIHEQKTLQNDAQGIIQEKLDREKLESAQYRDKIARLEAEVVNQQNHTRKENTDKKLAFQEVKQLQELVTEMEQTIHRVSAELSEAKSMNDDRQDQIRELDTQKRIYEERLILKDKEMAAYITAAEELTEQLAQLKHEYDDLDTKHVKLRAHEFDKIDVLKVNAELEGKVKNLQIDLENLICQRNKLQDHSAELEKTNAQIDAQAKQAQQELDYLRKTHEAAMDKFESKFGQFAQELTQLTEQNEHMREREKKFKRTINKLEVYNLELEEKFKYAQLRNTDLNSQVNFVESDMQKLAQETGEQVQIHMRTAENSQRRVDATDRAFADIKSMISNFRNERQSSKEKSATKRGRSGGRYTSRSPDIEDY